MAMKLPRSFLCAQLTSAAIPILVMVGMHLTWKDNLNARLRMGLKHVGFWTGMAGLLYTGHRIARKFLKTQPGKAWGLFLGTSLLPLAGYFMARALGHKLFPKSPAEKASESQAQSPEGQAPPFQTLPNPQAMSFPPTFQPPVDTYRPQTTASYYNQQRPRYFPMPPSVFYEYHQGQGNPMLSASGPVYQTVTINPYYPW